MGQDGQDGKDGKGKKEVIYCGGCYTTLTPGEACPKGCKSQIRTMPHPQDEAVIVPEVRLGVENPPANYGSYAEGGKNV